MRTRSDEEMLSLILDTAKNDKRILAVVMAGSRANEDNPRDIFMDFDIEYIVDDDKPFKLNREWAKQFGDPMIIQMPNYCDYDDPSDYDGEAFLMQFIDGTRIDLTVETLEQFKRNSPGEPRVVLYDPDNIIPPLPVPDGSIFFIKAPTAKQFDSCCNEYWWLHPYFAKEMWRGNYVLAHNWLNSYIRPMLIRMIGWKVGLENNWQKSIGKYGKFLRSCLTTQEWTMLMDTYTDADVDRAWDTIDKMDELFCRMAKEVGDSFGYYQYEDEAAKIKSYLKHVRSLPSDVEMIYEN